MDSSSMNRLVMTVVISTILVAISTPSYAPPQSNGTSHHEAETKQDKQDDKNKKDKNKAHKQQQRLSKQQQQERIREQKESLAQYRKNIEHRQAIAQRNVQQLQQQKRLAHYRFQQAYYERLRQQQAQLQDDSYDYDYNNDPFYYTAPNYRYHRDGRDYETNQYGADMLRKALNNGYQEGIHAGRADKEDNWRFDYKQSFAYEDANYGYDGRYVRQEDYNHYFREGFQRGYEDGYDEHRRYGSSTDGSDTLLGAVLNAILNLQTLQ